MNLQIIIAIIVFSIIVIFHELGHFLLAKANGIKVNEFSLGLGPTLFGITKGETKYSIKLLPFGGACMMEGEDEESDNPRAFQNKSVWARMSVVFAGPLFNFIMAFVFAFIIISFVGVYKPKVTEVSAGSGAQEAGIMAGDEVISLNGHRIHFFKEISLYNFFHAKEISENETVEMGILRNGEKMVISVKPTYTEEGMYLYGLTCGAGYEKGNFFENIGYSFCELRYWIDYTFNSLKYLVTGGASMNDLSGPVGIVSTMGDTIQESARTDGYFYAFLNVLNWTVLLSANLGVMNLLPLPALDGGRLFFLIIEAIRRKKIEHEGYVHAAGIVLLLLLMVVILFNDIRRFFI